MTNSFNPVSTRPSTARATASAGTQDAPTSTPSTSARASQRNVGGELSGMPAREARAPRTSATAMAPRASAESPKVKGYDPTPGSVYQGGQIPARQDGFGNYDVAHYTHPQTQQKYQLVGIKDAGDVFHVWDTSKTPHEEVAGDRLRTTGNGDQLSAQHSKDSGLAGGGFFKYEPDFHKGDYIDKYGDLYDKRDKKICSAKDVVMPRKSRSNLDSKVASRGNAGADYIKRRKDGDARLFHTHAVGEGKKTLGIQKPSVATAVSYQEDGTLFTSHNATDKGNKDYEAYKQGLFRDVVQGLRSAGDVAHEIAKHSGVSEDRLAHDLRKMRDDYEGRNLARPHGERRRDELVDSFNAMRIEDKTRQGTKKSVFHAESQLMHAGGSNEIGVSKLSCDPCGEYADELERGDDLRGRHAGVYDSWVHPDTGQKPYGQTYAVPASAQYPSDSDSDPQVMSRNPSTDPRVDPRYADPTRSVLEPRPFAYEPARASRTSQPGPSNSDGAIEIRPRRRRAAYEDVNFGPNPLKRDFGSGR